MEPNPSAQHWHATREASNSSCSVVTKEKPEAIQSLPDDPPPPILFPEAPLLKLDELSLSSSDEWPSEPPHLELQVLSIVNLPPQPGPSTSCAANQKQAPVLHHWDLALGVKQVIRKAHANATDIVRQFSFKW